MTTRSPATTTTTWPSWLGAAAEGLMDTPHSDVEIYDIRLTGGKSKHYFNGRAAAAAAEGSMVNRRGGGESVLLRRGEVRSGLRCGFWINNVITTWNKRSFTRICTRSAQLSAHYRFRAAIFFPIIRRRARLRNTKHNIHKIQRLYTYRKGFCTFSLDSCLFFFTPRTYIFWYGNNTHV